MTRSLVPTSLFLAVAPAWVFAQSLPSAQPLETGKFRLHKFEQPIGEENYTITRQGDELLLETDFKFTDRGRAVPLKATLSQSARDLTPIKFSIDGSTSRFSILHETATVDGATAHVETADGKRDIAVNPHEFFTIAGYAPVALQQAAVRYWLAHGKPAALATLPSGSLRIVERGVDKVSVNGTPQGFRRYSIDGLVWGLETLWLDENRNLAAVITRDAEFDHFEGVRDSYESGLARFVADAAADEMAQLDQLSRDLPGRETGSMAFVGATLIDGTGRAAMPGSTILTSGAKITAVGPSGAIVIPKDARRIDVSGKFIVPGLWDMHAHYEQVEWGPLYLAAGVTTVRDVGNEFEFISTIRDRVNSGAGLGPRLLLAGIVDGDGPMALGVDRVNSEEDAKRWVQKYHDAGFQQIKIYSSVSLDNVKAVCREAHRLGMTVTGHIPQGMTLYDGVLAGMDQVNHITYLTPLLRPKSAHSPELSSEQWLQMLKNTDVNGKEGRTLIAFLKKHHTVIDDTAVLFSLMSRPESKPAASEEPGIANVAPELRGQMFNEGLTAAQLPSAEARMRIMLDLLGAMHRAGIPIVAGTDQAVPGYSVYKELEIYVAAGFTPMEAMQAATLVPARVMKVEADSGTVEPGKRADFDILDANPLADIRNIRTVRRVVANGILYDSAPLWQSVGFTPPAAGR